MGEEEMEWKGDKAEVISELKRKKDIFETKKSRMQTKITEAESSPESKIL